MSRSLRVPRSVIFLLAAGLVAAVSGCTSSRSSQSKQPAVLPTRPSPTAAELREELRSRLELAVTRSELVAGGDPLFATSSLSQFYEQRGFHAAWSDSTRLQEDARRLIEALRDADSHGLRPADYHLGAVAELASQLPGPDVDRSAILCDLDLLLSDAFLIYGSHLVSGRIDPETFDPEWIAVRREVDVVSALEQALDQHRVRETLDGFLPVQPGYGWLRDALARYRRIAAAGGWRSVPTGPTLRRGEAGSRVEAVRRRLAVTGDLQAASETLETSRFDLTLENGVRAFQSRHGIDVDGVVGTKTLEAMNVSARARVRQIELNLERWRWLPRDLGNPQILVNIPAFHLDVVESGETVLEMRVVVGKDYRRTPVFSSRMRYLVINPYWELPPQIAMEDKLPLVLRNPDYLAEQRIHVYLGWGAGEREIDPADVDWAKIDPERFPYHLRQDPGPLNALGRIKFMFPNRFDVYLHDTPARELFARSERSFSSGCIRLEKPIDLAAYVLRDDSKWDRERIVAAIEAGAEKTVTLPRPVPIHLVYWTAWAQAGGSVHFRRDLYGRDSRLDTALRLPPPEGGEDGEEIEGSLPVPSSSNPEPGS